MISGYQTNCHGFFLLSKLRLALRGVLVLSFGGCKFCSEQWNLTMHLLIYVNLWLAELVGLSLSYVLLLNATLYNAVWLVSQLENKMVSVERIAQYSKLPSEAPAVVEQTRPPKSWPSQGTIKFKDLKVSSHPETERWRFKGNCT